MLKSEKMLSIFQRISVQNFPSFKEILPVPCDVCFAIQSVRQDAAITARRALGGREERQESSAQSPLREKVRRHVFYFLSLFERGSRT